MTIHDSANDYLLRNGTIGHFRSVRPSDRADLVNLYESLSETSLYLRFLSIDLRRSVEFVDSWMISVASGNAFGQVCLVNGQLVGAASCVRFDGKSGEIGFVVADDLHGIGIGTLLLERLADQAESLGIEEFIITMLTSNRKILDMVRASGFIGKARRNREFVDARIPVRTTERLRSAMTERERVAGIASMLPLFQPSAIAVIGATRSVGSAAHGVLDSLLSGAFPGPVYSVDPDRATRQGVTSYRSVGAIPFPVDLAIIDTAPATVTDVLRECAASNIGGAVILSSGFAETGARGRRQQDELLAVARGLGIRIVGPRSLGLINNHPDVRLNSIATIPEKSRAVAPEPGNVALLAEAGTAMLLLRSAQEHVLGLSTFLSVGNKADVSANDAITYFSWDERTDVIALALESFGNVRKFSRLTRLIGRQKPIVALAGAESRVSGEVLRGEHMPSLPSRAVTEAFFEQCGVLQATSLRHFLQLIALLSKQPLPRGHRVVVLGNGHESSSLAARAMEDAGISLNDLDEDTTTSVRRSAPRVPVIGNPINLGSEATPDELGATLRALSDHDEVDVIIAVHTPSAMLPTDHFTETITAAAAEAHQITMLATMLGRDNRSSLRDTPQHTVPVFDLHEEAARTLAQLLDYVRWRNTEHGTISPFDVRHGPARHILATVLSENPEGRFLTESETRSILAHYGMSFGQGTSEPHGEQAISDQPGSAIVEASASPRVPRQFDPDSFGSGAHTPSDHSTGTAQRRASNSIALNLRLTHDRDVGPLIALAAAGDTTDGDPVLRLTPITDTDAANALEALLTARPLLRPDKDNPGVNVKAVEDLLQHLGRFIDDLPEISGIDLSPVLVHENGVEIAVGRILVRPPGHPAPRTGSTRIPPRQRDPRQPSGSPDETPASRRNRPA